MSEQYADKPNGLDRKTKAMLSFHDHGTREGATASRVKRAMLDEGFTIQEIAEAVQSYGR